MSKSVSSSRKSVGKTNTILSLAEYLVLAIAIAIFIIIALHYDFVQDDAYISFRYAANLLSGNGLVYNVGEHVEGYTNFLWIILLASFKKTILMDYITSARILSLLGGGMIFIISFLFAKLHSKNDRLVIMVSSAILLLSNQALAYWTVSGLETMAFAFLCFISLYLEYSRPRLTPAALVLATLTRPEGGLLFVVILLHRIVKQRRFPISFSAIYVLPLVPLAAFKLLYYGSLIPNPFYAKSGFGFEYITSGFEYLWQFLSTAGIYGLVLLIPLIALPRLWSRYSLLYLFVGTYIAYIVWVGGDVLKVYRFFVPILPPLLFLLAISVSDLANILFEKLQNKSYWRQVIIISFIASFGLLSYTLARKHVITFWDGEQKLTQKMEYTGIMLKKYMKSDFSIAASTIGALGYQLMGHRVIDMLGLTDPYIARNPENIGGLITTWKERRFNSRYLLEQQPDFIIFSTNFKPSAPAERALMLHSEFRKKYSPSGFARPGSVEWAIFYRRRGAIEMAKDRIHTDLTFTNQLNEAYGQLNKGNLVASCDAFRAAGDNLKEEYDLIYSGMGEALARQKLLDSSRIILLHALALDPESWQARMSLASIARMVGDSIDFEEQIKVIKRIAPWSLGN